MRSFQNAPAIQGILFGFAYVVFYLGTDPLHKSWVLQIQGNFFGLARLMLRSPGY